MYRRQTCGHNIRFINCEFRFPWEESGILVGKLESCNCTIKKTGHEFAIFLEWVAMMIGEGQDGLIVW